MQLPLPTQVGKMIAGWGSNCLVEKNAAYGKGRRPHKDAYSPANNPEESMPDKLKTLAKNALLLIVPS